MDSEKTENKKIPMSFDGAPLDYGYDHSFANYIGVQEGPQTVNFRNTAKHLVSAMNLDSLRAFAKKAAPDSAKPPSTANKDVSEKQASYPLYAVDDETVQDLEKMDPTETRKFKKLLEGVDDPSHPLNGSFETVASLLGIYSGVRNGSELRDDDSFIRELAGKLNKEEFNDAAASNIIEGLNRSLNVFTRFKAYNPKTISTPEELLEDAVSYLTAGNNLNKELEAYRKAGNLSNLDHDKKPNAKVKPRNNRYVKLVFPHEGKFLQNKAAESASRELKKTLDEFMVESSKKGPDARGKVRVHILEASWVKRAKPVGEYSNVAAILKIGNKSFISEYELDSADTDEGSIEKLAGAISLVKAQDFAQSFGLVQRRGSAYGPSRHTLEEVLYKWFTLMVLEGYGSNLPLNSTTKKRVEGLPKEALNELKIWAQEKNYRVQDSKLFGVLDQIQRDVSDTVEKVADIVDDMFLSYLQRQQDSGDKTYLVEKSQKFFNNVPKLLVHLVENRSPLTQELLLSWLDTNKQTTQNLRDIPKRLTKDMLSKVHGRSGESQWSVILDQYKGSPDANVLVTLFEDWGEALASAGRAEDGAKIRRQASVYASDMAERVLEPCLLNDTPSVHIAAYVERALETIAGGTAIKTVPVKAPTTRTVPEGDNRFAYLVFITGDFTGMSEDMRPMTLIPGHNYDLVYGPLSSLNKGHTSGKEKSEQYVATGYYILQVDDGRRVVTLDEARLSTGEIPKFFEFVANSYAAKEAGGPERVEDHSFTGRDGDITPYLDSISEDIFQQGNNVGTDPVYQSWVAKAIKGKRSTQDVADFLKLLDKQKKGMLADTLHRLYKSKIDKVGDEFEVTPSTHQVYMREVEGAPYKDYTDQRTEDVSKSLSTSLPSIKSLKLGAPGTNTAEMFDSILKTKEVSEGFLKKVLNLDEPLPNSKVYPAYSALLMDTLKEVLHDNDLDEYLDYVLTTKKGVTGYAGAETVQKVSDMIDKANKNLGSRETGKAMRTQYSAAWEQARNKNSKLFDSLFIPSKRLSLKTTTSIKEGLLDEIIILLAEGIPGLKRLKTFSDVLVKDSADQWVVRKVDADGTKIKTSDKRNLINEIFNLAPTKATEILTSEGLDSVVKDPSQSDEIILYSLRPKPEEPKDVFAFSQNLVQFMRENNDPDEVGFLISRGSGKYLDWNKLRSGVRSIRIKTTKGGSPTENKAAFKRGVDDLLNHYLETIQTDPEANELLSQGRDIGKAMNYLERLDRSKGGDTLTQQLYKALKESDNFLFQQIKKQDEVVKQNIKDGKPTKTKVDYNDIDERVRRKTKYVLEHFLNKKPLLEQKRVKQILDKLVSRKSISDPYLSSKENINVLINLAGAKDIRPRMGI
jgi:hypothetical protein